MLPILIVGRLVVGLLDKSSMLTLVSDCKVCL